MRAAKCVLLREASDIARVWDSQSGELIQALEGHQSSVNTASFSPDGSRIVTASSDNTARVWGVYNLDK